MGFEIPLANNISDIKNSPTQLKKTSSITAYGLIHSYTYYQYKTTITQPGERYGEIRYGGNDYGSKTYGSEKYGGSGAKYGYDPENNIEYIYDEETGSLKYVKYPRNKIISYDYDEEENTSSVTDIRGYTTVYERNEDGQTIKVTYRGMEIAYTYDSQDRISTMTLPNGIVKTITYYNENGASGGSSPALTASSGYVR